MKDEHKHLLERYPEMLSLYRKLYREATNNDPLPSKACDRRVPIVRRLIAHEYLEDLVKAMDQVNRQELKGETE